MTERQGAIVEKIRKLLALGESDNEHEAALAIARANALMEKYDIEETMIHLDDGTEDEPVVDSVLFGKGKQKIYWRGRLAGVLASANGCDYYWSSGGWGRDKHTHIKIVGRKSDSDWVRQLFTHCALEIDRLTAKHAKGREFGRAFRFGCVQAIEEAIAAEKRRLRDELRADAERRGVMPNLEKALTIVDNRKKEARSWMSMNLNLRYGGGPSGSLDPEGHAAGRRAGADIYGRATRRRVK
jgi:hypothetical protein